MTEQVTSTEVQQDQSQEGPVKPQEEPPAPGPQDDLNQGEEPIEDDTLGGSDEGSEGEEESDEDEGIAISHGEVAGVHETADPDLVPPGQETHVVEVTEFEAEIDRLGIYLHTRFPDQVELSNRQHPESAVDTAIRLLDGYASRSSLQHSEERCAEQYCNKYAGHIDVHGWVHFN